MIPEWATWEAVDPDGARHYFEAEPVEDELPGVFAHPNGRDYEFGDPVPCWQPPEDTWYQLAGQEAPPADWRTTKRRLDGGQLRLELEVAA